MSDPVTWAEVIVGLREEVRRAHASVERGHWDAAGWTWEPPEPVGDPSPLEIDELRRLAGELELAVATVEEAIEATRGELDAGDRRRTAARSYVANAGRA